MFAKEAEKYHLFFLEDALSPEDIDYFRQIRQQCTTPIAMGELFNSPHEWTPLIAERLIDYIRIHVSQAGGFTPCRKIAAFGEMFGVRTAWHGPGDVSPVGHTAHLTLDLVCYNFGIQEYSPFNDQHAVHFSGLPRGAERLYVCQRKAGLGHGSGREGGRQVSLRLANAASAQSSTAAGAKYAGATARSSNSSVLI